MPTQKSFCEAQKLNFPLLSDPDGRVARQYGVLPEGRRAASRVTFVIDFKGVIRHIDAKVNVAQHGKDLLNAIKKLQAEHQGKGE